MNNFHPATELYGQPIAVFLGHRVVVGKLDRIVTPFTYIVDGVAYEITQTSDFGNDPSDGLYLDSAYISEDQP